ncbi:DUF4097 family beta strand repeat-containing protein [Oceanobacillus arenosus]|nr:DUF4097 family beta strand repeat-containing protein [Oceanobacillus arenosus]
MKKGLLIGVLIAVAVVIVIINFIPLGANGRGDDKVTINDDFSHVDVETENVEIEILPTNGNSTEIELMGNENNKYRLVTNVEGDTLHIEVKNKRFRWFSFGLFNRSSASLKVLLPEKPYENVEVVTDNGKIFASEMEADVVKIEADNGQIALNEIKCTLLNAEVDNGDVSLENIDGEINGTSNNGRISLRTDSLDRPITLETDNGAIEIQTEKEPTNATFDIHVDNGKISIFGKSDYDTVIGNGDNLIKLTTDNGKITVR